MKQERKMLQDFLHIFVGALLTGMLWRMRGTHGWGSSWGVFAVGFVLILYLAAIAPKTEKTSFPMLCIAAFSFMLTTPGWGTLLSQITGVLTVSAKTEADSTATYAIHPASAITLMLCLGFGMACFYGILLGKCFGGKPWKLWHYGAVLLSFYVVQVLAKLTLAHALLHVLQPQASEAFAAGLQQSGITESVYRVYLAHFEQISWAKKIVGGRNYYQSIQVLATALGSCAALLCTRFVVRDKQASRTGAVVCGAFAFAITVSDLFFFFDNGGYRMLQGFSLPDNMAAWSLWEYFTGFFAGGIITAYVLRKPLTADSVAPELECLPQTMQRVLAFVVCFAGAVGINFVRPVLVRLDETPLYVQIPAAVLTGAAVLIVSLLLCRRCAWQADRIDSTKFCTALCCCLAAWFLMAYLFLGDGAVHDLHALHNQLVLLSFLAVLAWGAISAGKTDQNNPFAGNLQ